MTSSSFYRRILPSPPAIAFSSRQGKQLFKEAMIDGYMEKYFILAEQFTTQAEPAFCGISTLSMVLNALAVDPGRIWKGAWRWYSETMLDCCRPLSEIQKHGIQLDEFVCLAECNSLRMILKRPMQRHIYPTREHQEPLIEYNIDDGSYSNSTDEHKQLQMDSTTSNVVNGVDGTDCATQCAHPHRATKSTLNFFCVEEFREDIKRSCVTSNGCVIVSYSRKGLKQTGDGHFSPIASYHAKNDMVLIMDVARFKYPPHWVSVEVLYDAMCRIDPSCNKTRGWMIAYNAERKQPYFFTVNDALINAQTFEQINDRLCCCSVRFLQALNDTSSDTLQNDSACTCAHASTLTVVGVIKCLLQCLPTPLNAYIVSQTEKFGVELEATHELIKEKLLQGIRNNGIYCIVQNIFGDGDKHNQDLIERFAKCKLEIVTLMVLTIGNEKVWRQICNDQVRKELQSLTRIDSEKYPELEHEVIALQHQIKNLQQYLMSTYPKCMEQNEQHCCHRQQ